MTKLLGVRTSSFVMNISNKEAFFLRHTARLPSSTSQLVLFHHLFCIHFLGGGVHFHVHFWGGVYFHVHFWGGPLPCSLLGGSTSMFTSGGPLPCSLLGVHFCVHFWGSHVTYPIMHLILPLCSPDTK